jgi:hypothetical protein
MRRGFAALQGSGLRPQHLLPLLSRVRGLPGEAGQINRTPKARRICATFIEKLTMLNRGLAFVVACSILAPIASVRAETPKPIDLKLFEKTEVDRSKGCSVVLWQDNKDPETDKYAYLFAETLSGKNHTRQPARIKIGDAVTTLKRVAKGGKTTGYDLFEFQLYQLPAPNEYVVLQLKLAEEQGESVDVEAGKMIVIMDGKPVFRTSVKGNAGCMTAAAAAPPPKATAAPNRGKQAPPNKALSAMEACQKAAADAADPTEFKCDWKAAIDGAPGSSLTGRYAFREKGMSGIMTILDPVGEPADIGFATVANSRNAPTCTAAFGASRDGKDELVATMDDPKVCKVRIFSVPGPNMVKVVATDACNSFCGMGATFSGLWQLQAK